MRIFSPEAADVIAKASGGVPRLINVLAHKCLMLAYGEDTMTVTSAHARLAVRDTEGVPKPLPWWSFWTRPRRGRLSLQRAKGNAP